MSRSARSRLSEYAAAAWRPSSRAKRLSKTSAGTGPVALSTRWADAMSCGSKIRREPFMQPRRHAAGSQRRDHRVRQLMREDTIELRQILPRAFHRHANTAVEDPVGPLGRAGQITKLLFGVERHRDRAGRVRANRTADPPVRGIQNRERAVRQRAIRRSLEDDGEPAVVALCQAAMNRQLLAPRLEPPADVGISGLLGEHVLVRGDRIIQRHQCCTRSRRAVSPRPSASHSAAALF